MKYPVNNSLYFFTLNYFFLFFKKIYKSIILIENSKNNCQFNVISVNIEYCFFQCNANLFKEINILFFYFTNICTLKVSRLKLDIDYLRYFHLCITIYNNKYYGKYYLPIIASTRVAK